VSWDNELLLFICFFVIPRSDGDEESGFCRQREQPRSLASLGMTTIEMTDKYSFSRWLRCIQPGATQVGELHYSRYELTGI